MVPFWLVCAHAWKPERIYSKILNSAQLWEVGLQMTSVYSFLLFRIFRIF